MLNKILIHSTPMKYFKFYVDRFLVGTSYFSPTEVGIYIRMLCYQFDKGYLPADKDKLNTMFGSPVTDNILAKFDSCDLGLFNARLHDEVGKGKAKSTIMSKMGSKGAKKRWNGDTLTDQPPAEKVAGANFYIGINGYHTTPSQWMQEEGRMYVEAQLMKHKLGNKAEATLKEAYDLMDSDYNHYDFTSSNHIKNAFRTCLTKVLSKNTTGGKAALGKDGSERF